MERMDWLMLLLGTSDGTQGPTAIDRARTMKCLFLVGERLPRLRRGAYYNFGPYNYGPFDSDVYRDADRLIAAGLAEAVTDRGQTAYRATEAGQARARTLAQQDPEAAVYLARVRTWANGLSFSAILRAIYAEWPEMSNSVFFTRADLW